MRTTKSSTSAKVERKVIELTPIEQVAKALNGVVDRFSDGSQSWVLIENKDWAMNICFNGEGDKFEEIIIARKVYQVVSEEVVARIGAKRSK